MRRQTVESYIAYPAIIPFPLIHFIGGVHHPHLCSFSPLFAVPLLQRYLSGRAQP